MKLLPYFFSIEIFSSLKNKGNGNATIRKNKNLNKTLNIFLKNQKNGITNILIFGSVARKEDTDKSDLNIVVSVKNKPYLLKVLRLRERLKALFEINVDVVVDESLPDDFKAIQYRELIQ